MRGMRHTVATMTAQRNNRTVDEAVIERVHERKYCAFFVPIDVRASVYAGGSA
jgi:hypothetical protein